MSNYPLLDDYIKKSREKGKSNKELEEEMLLAGYNKKDIRGVLGSRVGFFKKIIMAILTILGLYIVVAFILISINPLFAWIVLAPYFIVQDSIGDLKVSVTDINNKRIPESDAVLPSELIEIEYNDRFQNQFEKINESSSLFKYLKEFKIDITTKLEYFNTSKGDIIFESKYANGGSYYLTNIYYVDSEKLVKIATFTESTISLYKDENNNVYVLEPKAIPLERYDSKNFYVFEKGGILKRIKNYTSTKIKLCSSENKNQCDIVYVTGEFNDVPEDNSFWREEQNNFFKDRKFSELNSSMLSCLNKFEKSINSNIGRSLADLNTDPFYTCVTDPNSKPFDFDIYIIEPKETAGLSYFVNFKDKKGAMVYKVGYSGYTISNYSKNSVAYKIYKDIIDGKYKEGQYSPVIDNLEQVWSAFNPNSIIDSIKQEEIGGVNVLTISQSFVGERFKIFELGKTYIVVSYSSVLNVAISENEANSIVRQLIKSSPYVPIKQN